MVRVLLMVLFIFPVILLAGQDSIPPNKDARALTSDSSVIYQFRAFSDQAEGVVDLNTIPDAIQQPDPIRQEGIYFGNLGNIGSSHKFLVYDAVPDITFDMGFHAFDLYRLNVANAIFYKGYRPYTKVFFTQMGGQGNGIFRGTYGRELSKTLSLHLDFSRMANLGYYQRQKIKHTGLTLGLWYQGMKNRYKAWLMYGSNYNNQQDNGGIATDTLFDNEIYSRREAIPVRLLNADTRYVQYELSYKQLYSLVNPGKPGLFYLVHQSRYVKQTFKFSDTYPNVDFYGPFYTYPKGLRYFSEVKGIQNYFGIQTGIASNRRSFIIEPGVSYNRYNITLDSTAYNWNELWLHGSLSGSVGPFSLLVQGQYGLLDALNSFRLSGEATGDIGKWATLSAKLILQKYAGTSMMYGFNLSKLPIWEGSPEKTTELAIYANLEIKPVNLNIYARQFVLNNYIYFDQQALVKQLAGAFTINQFGAEHRLKFWKIHFNNKIHFQTKSEDVIRFPEWITTHSLYFDGKIFKNYLQIRPGIDLRYLSSYYADNYMPASGQFYLQDKTKLPDQWLTDVFLGIGIANFQGFVKMENVTNWVKKGIQYYVPFYPQPEAKFRIGLQWQFLN